METLEPRDEKELAEVVQAALANESPLDIVGGGSRSGLGRPTNAPLRVSTRGLSGIVMYEPSELILVAQAGTPLDTITGLLDQQGQEFAFEPIDHGPLYGLPERQGTAGGLTSVNASGPRRIKAGAARDHLLGFRAVNGRGEIFQSGGRVVKNVTGYDMSKLMAGAFGTLGILSEVIIKVLPKAETQTTLAITGVPDANAVTIMTLASGLPQEVSGLAHIPGPMLPAFPNVPAAPDREGTTVLRVEGPEASIRQRLEHLTTHLGAELTALGRTGCTFTTMDAPASAMLWRALRDCQPFARSNDQLWRISTTPTEAARVVEDIRKAEIPILGHFYDWAGGLIWLSVSPAPDAHAPAIRQALALRGGHATLVRAADDVRAATAVFQPQPDALAALSARVKNSFDPENILNRGRMRGDL